MKQHTNKNLRRGLAVLLSVVMALSCFTAAFGVISFAAGASAPLLGRYFSTTNPWYDAVTDNGSGLGWVAGSYPSYDASSGFSYLNGDAYLRINNTGLFSGVSASTGLTVAFLYKPNAGGNYRHLLSFGANDASNINKHLYISSNPSHVGGGRQVPVVGYVDNNGAEHINAYPADGPAFTVGQTYDVMISISATEITYLINGVLCTTACDADSAAYLAQFLNEVGTYQNNFIGRSRWNDPNFDGYVKDLRIYGAALLEKDNLITANAAAYDSAYGSTNLTTALTQSNVASQFNAVAYHYSDVATGGYRNLVYASGQNTTLLTNNDGWVEVKGTKFKAFTPATVVMVTADADGTYFPVQVETQRKDGTVWDNHIRHIASNFDGVFDLIQPWAQTLDGTYGGNFWERWAGTTQSFGPEYISQLKSGETEKDDKNDTSRFAWNAIRYIGGNTSSSYSYYRFIEFEAKAYCTWTGARDDEKTGTGTFRTNEGSNFFVLNYKPVYDALPYALACYNEMTANAWMYTDESLARAKATIYQMIAANPKNSDYNYASDASAATVACAANITRAVNLLGASVGGTYGYEGLQLVKKTGTVTFNNDDGTLYQTITADYGDTFTVPAVPAKASTAQYEYINGAWDPEATPGSAVMSDTYAGQTFTASYTQSTRSYTITWNFQNAGGTQTATSSVPYGETPTAPTGTEGNYSIGSTLYTFGAWSPSVTAVSGEATYIATYTESTLPAATATMFATDTRGGNYRTGINYTIYNLTEGSVMNSINDNLTIKQYYPDTYPVTGDGTYRRTYQNDINNNINGSTALLEVDRSQYSDISETGIRMEYQPFIHTQEGHVRWGVQLLPYQENQIEQYVCHLGEGNTRITVTGDKGGSYTYKVMLDKGNGTLIERSGETGNGLADTDVTTYTNQDLYFGPYTWYLHGAAPAVGETVKVRVAAICCTQGTGDYNGLQTLVEWTELTIKGVCTHSNGYTATTTDYLKEAANCVHGNIYYKSCPDCGASSQGTEFVATFDDGQTNNAAHDYHFSSFTWSGNTAVANLVCSRNGSHTTTAPATVTPTSHEATYATGAYTVYTATYTDGDNTYTGTKDYTIPVVTTNLAAAITTYTLTPAQAAQYTAESLAPLTSAIEAAQSLVNNASATVTAEGKAALISQFEAARDAMANAYGALATRTLTVTWKKTATDEAVKTITVPYGTDASAQAPAIPADWAHYDANKHYTYAWADTDLSNVTDDITVLAVETGTDHTWDYANATYAWNDTNTVCTATVGCTDCAQTTTIDSTGVTASEPNYDVSCTTDVQVTYTAAFAESGLAQSKTVTVGQGNNHDWEDHWVNDQTHPHYDPAGLATVNPAVNNKVCRNNPSHTVTDTVNGATHYTTGDPNYSALYTQLNDLAALCAGQEITEAVQQALTQANDALAAVGLDYTDSEADEAALVEELNAAKLKIDALQALVDADSDGVLDDGALVHYTITWNLANGTQDTTSVNHGVTPTHADDTKAASEWYTYSFDVWSPAPAAATGDAAYTSTFTRTATQALTDLIGEAQDIVNNAEDYDEDYQDEIGQIDDLLDKYPDTITEAELETLDDLVDGAEDYALYTITFETNGGSAVGPITEKNGTEVTLPDSAKDGCHFEGWYTDSEFAAGTKVTSPYTLTASITLYAFFEELSLDGNDVEAAITAATAGVTMEPCYTADSYQTYTDAIAAVRAFKDQPATSANLTAYNNALTALDNAVDGLVEAHAYTGEATLARPVYNEETETWSQGVYTTLCANGPTTHPVKTEYVDRANYTKYDSVLSQINTLLQKDLTDDVKTALQTAKTAMEAIEQAYVVPEQSILDGLIQEILNTLNENDKITVDEDGNITVSDDAYNTYTLTVSNNINSSVKTYTYKAGTQVTLTLSLPGYVFKSWSENANLDAATGVYTFPQANDTLTALYVKDLTGNQTIADAQGIIDDNNDPTTGDDYDATYIGQLEDLIDAINAIKDDPTKLNEVEEKLTELQGKVDQADANKVYKITFVTDGSAVEAISAKVNTAVDLPESTLEGSTFNGWFTDEARETAVTLNAVGKYVVTGNVTLYAKFTTTVSGPADYEEYDELFAILETLKDDDRILPNLLEQINEKVDNPLSRDLTADQQDVIDTEVEAIKALLDQIVLKNGNGDYTTTIQESALIHCTVTFYWLTTKLERTVVKGETVTAPNVIRMYGVEGEADGHYVFAGWDRDLANITENEDIHGSYELEAHTGNWKTHEATCSRVEWAEIDCTTCEMHFKKDTGTEKAPHDFSDWTVVEATCAHPGSKTRTCRNDASHVETIILPQLAHVDANNDTICDICGNPTEAHTHSDWNGDGKCDTCGAPTTAHSHNDANHDGVCDGCGKNMDGSFRCNLCPFYEQYRSVPVFGWFVIGFHFFYHLIFQITSWR